MPSDWNAKVIEEFRANAGVVANFGGPLLLLHTTGAKTGREHVTPVMYRKVDGGYAVFASFAGQPRNPAWYHNLVAQPDVVIHMPKGCKPARMATRNSSTLVCSR